MTGETCPCPPGRCDAPAALAHGGVCKRRAAAGKPARMAGITINGEPGGPFEPWIATRPQDWAEPARSIIFGRQRA